MSINIDIDSWHGTTTNGQNEKELIEDLDRHIDNEHYQDIYGKKLFDIKMLIATIVGLILIVLTWKQPIFMIFIILAIIIFDGYNFYVNYNERRIKIKRCEEIKSDARYILLNTIAEVVDFYFICQESRKIHDQINTFINGLDYRNYINSENSQRNIEIGGKYES